MTKIKSASDDTKEVKRYIDLRGKNILNVDDDDEDESFVSFVDNLNSVGLDHPNSNLNETTIGDNNGGRIILNEDDTQIIKR